MPMIFCYLLIIFHTIENIFLKFERLFLIGKVSKENLNLYIRFKYYMVWCRILKIFLNEIYLIWILFWRYSGTEQLYFFLMCFLNFLIWHFSKLVSTHGELLEGSKVILLFLTRNKFEYGWVNKAEEYWSAIAISSSSCINIWTKFQWFEIWHSNFMGPLAVLRFWSFLKMESIISYNVFNISFEFGVI